VTWAPEIGHRGGEDEFEGVLAGAFLAVEQVLAEAVGHGFAQQAIAEQDLQNQRTVAADLPRPAGDALGGQVLDIAFDAGGVGGRHEG
jgi:hypothetical protein